MRIQSIIMAIAGLIQFGCSNPFGGEVTQVDTNYGFTPGAVVVLPAPAGYETVSGAKSDVLTTNGRKVDISAGQSAGALKLTTTNNRTVLINVQGQMYE